MIYKLHFADLTEINAPVAFIDDDLDNPERRAEFIAAATVEHDYLVGLRGSVQ